MRGQSSTTLPAMRVKFACGRAISEIKEQRAILKRAAMDDWIKNYRIAHPFKSMLTNDRQLEHLIPPAVYAIPDQYRENDESLLSALRSLSIAAVEAGENFTILITADDFRLIQKFYNDGAIHGYERSVDATGSRDIPLGRSMGGLARIGSAAQEGSRADVGTTRRFHVAPLAVVDYPPPPRSQAGASFSPVTRVREDPRLTSRSRSARQPSQEGEQYNE